MTIEYVFGKNEEKYVVRFYTPESYANLQFASTHSPFEDLPEELIHSKRGKTVWLPTEETFDNFASAFDRLLVIYTIKKQALKPREELPSNLTPLSTDENNLIKRVSNMYQTLYTMKKLLNSTE